MKNINAAVSPDGKILTLTINLEDRHGKSSSGKNLIVASTEGNLDVEGHPGMKMGVNIFTKE